MSPISLCPFALITGQPCPGCGMGRALWACLHADFAAAYAVHPLGPVVFTALAALGAARLANIVSPRVRELLAGANAAFDTSRWWQVALVATFGIWLARFAGAFGGPAEVAPPLYSWFE